VRFPDFFGLMMNTADNDDITDEEIEKVLRDYYDWFQRVTGIDPPRKRVEDVVRGGKILPAPPRIEGK
jgi:hypothetical protein